MKNLFLLIIVGTLLWSCGKDDPENEALSNNLALVPTADQIILPSYADFSDKITGLQTAKYAFFANPGETELISFRNQLKSAWISWQSCAPLNFGPALEFDLSARTNTFPLSANEMLVRIESGNTAYASAQWGFPAIDYLLNAGESDAVILERFSGANSEQYKNYLNAILNDLRSRVNEVHTSWTNSYRNAFVSNTGNQAGSASSLLINSMVQDFETLKRNKLALPLGLLTLGIALPEKVEAYYGGYSMELAVAHQQAIHDLFMGVSKLDGVEYYGIDDLLDEAGAEYNGQNLSQVIHQSFEEAESQMLLVPDPLHQSIVDYPGLVEDAYDALQSIVVYLKTDMPSSLGISITFSDNDGD